MRIPIAVTTVLVLATSPMPALAQRNVHAGIPQVSRDCKLILFASTRDGGFHVYMSKVDGTGPTRLLGATASAWSATWGPASQTIIYVAPQNTGDTSDVVIARLDGSTRRVLATGPDAGWPQLSPDGKWIAFAMGMFPTIGVYLISVDGTGLRNLTSDLKTASEPAWSPDGRHLLFVVAKQDSTGGRWASSSMFVMKADGTDKKLVARLEGVAQRPSWSPDGRTVAFQLATPDLKDIQVYVADLASGQAHSITPHQAGKGLWDETPCWLPNGERLVFGSNRDGQMELYMMRADGSDQRRLTF